MAGILGVLVLRVWVARLVLLVGVAACAFGILARLVLLVGVAACAFGILARLVLLVRVAACAFGIRILVTLVLLVWVAAYAFGILAVLLVWDVGCGLATFPRDRLLAALVSLKAGSAGVVGVLVDGELSGPHARPSFFGVANLFFPAPPQHRLGPVLSTVCNLARPCSTLCRLSLRSSSVTEVLAASWQLCSAGSEASEVKELFLQYLHLP